ncbi:MAG: preprotein translocase subunit SecE [Candidatus Kerfeldbacteria bacterium]
MQQTQENKGNPLTTYLKGAYAELKKVTWPTRKETWKKSWVVIWFSLAFAVFLGALDFALNKILEVII